MKELKKYTTLPIIMKGIHKCQTDIKIADLKGLAAVLHELHGLPIGVQYAALATVVIIVIASLIAGCYMVSHF